MPVVKAALVFLGEEWGNKNKTLWESLCFAHFKCTSCADKTVFGCLCLDYIHIPEWVFSSAALDQPIPPFIAPSCSVCAQFGCSRSSLWACRWEGGCTRWGASPSSRKRLASAGGPGWTPYPCGEKEEQRFRLTAHTHTVKYDYEIYSNQTLACILTLRQSPVQWRHSLWQTVEVPWGDQTSDWCFLEVYSVF